MNIHVLDDYQDTIRTLAAFAKIAGHQVTIWRDHTKEVEVLAERLHDVEAICLLRERTPIRAALIERLDRLRRVCWPSGALAPANGGCSRDPASSDSLAFLS